MKDSRVLNKALELLSKYPLCDSCLGRCFARLGYGLENKERGKAIKTVLLLELDSLIKDHRIDDMNQIKEILFNIGEIAKPLFSLYFSNERFQERFCYLCNNQIEDFKKDFLNKIMREEWVKEYSIVLGFRLSESFKRIEEEFVAQNDLSFYETIKNEIKREVGKELAKAGYKIDIEKADVEIVYDQDTRSIDIKKKPRKYLYSYIRLSRNIPVSSWYAKEGKSLEQILGNKKIFVPFSEYSEIRILDEYPIIIEDLNKDFIEAEGYFMNNLGEVKGKEFEVIMQSKPNKRVYKVLVYSEKELENAEKVYENLYDIYIEAVNSEELIEKLRALNVEVIAIDLIEADGKHKKIIETFMNRNRY
ncbi:MAG: pseudouridylate synthase [Sulfolobaceae archaeon]